MGNMVAGIVEDTVVDRVDRVDIVVDTAAWRVGDRCVM
jgi:hypothetical protein